MNNLAKILFAQFAAICISLPLLAQTKVVLKLDDIAAQKNSCKSLPVMEYLLQRNVKASYGVIANRLDETAYPLLSKVLNAVDTKGKPMVEIWHHGLAHSRNGDIFEFKNTPYEQQKKSFDSAHELVKKHLKVNMSTFGAPFNAVDSVCLKVIAEHGGYTKVFYAYLNVNFKTGFDKLNNRVGIEIETGKPDFNYFMSEYKKNTSYLHSNIVLQGHPPQWTEEGFAEFKKILDFLDTKHAEYVLPSQL